MLPPPAPPSVTTATTSVAAMKWHRRILILAAPTVDDPALVRQRQALAAWRQAAEDRDVTIVEVVGGRVAGATDAAIALRGRRHLPADRFQAILIGKDGHEAFRTDKPVATANLGQTIDAMPMRRAGQR